MSAMVVDGETLIHANAHHMAVAYEPIGAAIAPDRGAGRRGASPRGGGFRPWGDRRSGGEDAAAWPSGSSYWLASAQMKATRPTPPSTSETGMSKTSTFISAPGAR